MKFLIQNSGLARKALKFLFQKRSFTWNFSWADKTENISVLRGTINKPIKIPSHQFYPLLFVLNGWWNFRKINTLWSINKDKTLGKKENYNLHPTSKYKCKINNFSNPLRGISCKTKSHYSPCRVTTIIQQTLVKLTPKKLLLHYLT